MDDTGVTLGLTLSLFSWGNHTEVHYIMLQNSSYQYSWSWTTIVVHSRDDKELGEAHEVKSPENQPQISQIAMEQYWLGKTKPKKAFRLTRNAFKKVPQNVKLFFINRNFLLAN